MRHLLLCCSVSAAVLIGGCSTNPSTGRSQLLLVDSDQVAEMGMQATPELVKEYGGEVKSPELRQYVRQVGRKLAQQVEPEYDDIDWKFHVLDSDVINAFALPPGNVFVSRGLLEKLGSEAELAHVLGHEIGHITGMHVEERVSQSSLVSTGAQIAGAAVGGEGAASQLIPAVIGLGGQGYLLKFGRDQESEADRQGVKYLVKAGYNPRGAEKVTQVLIDADQGGRQWEMLSTHPDPKRRLQAIRELIDEEYRHTRNNDQYKMYEARYEDRARPYLR